MKKRCSLTLLLVLFVTLSGCGVTTKEKTGSTNTPNNPSPQTSKPFEDSTPDSEKSIVPCNNTLQSENHFSDYFVSNNNKDIHWSVSSYNVLTNHAIEHAFNKAREMDPTVNSPMVLPPQDIWSSYNSSEKVLYLVNKERCDRGFRPYEGIDENIQNVAQNYAQFLKEHPQSYDTTPHTADHRTPWERMEQDAGVKVGDNADFFPYAENIASIQIGSSGNDYPNVYAPEAKSVYGWLYEDKDSSYGHRKFILTKGLVENSGINGVEGLIGIGIATRIYKENNLFWTQKIIVMDGFDPNSNWDNNLQHTKHIMLYK